jgi:hypothetical protein
MLGMPIPAPPLGLYARGLDPIALDQLGYARDHVVCAALHASGDDPRSNASGVAELVALVRSTSLAVQRIGGACTCDTAFALGLRELVSVCRDRPAKRECTGQENAAEIRAALEPVVQALERTRVDMVHWRLAGKTDRKGVFAENLADLLPRYPKGSTVFKRGQPPTGRGAPQLMERLIGLPDVQAVVTQEGGEAFVIVREVGDALVLDHFSYGISVATQTGLLASLGKAHIDSIVAALEPPARRVAFAVDPARGNFVELDRPALERLDDQRIGLAPLAGAVYDREREHRVEPPLLVDHVAIQAPFGHDGMWMKAVLNLTVEGRAWAAELGEKPLSATLEELRLPGGAHEFVAGGRVPDSFYVRGTLTDRMVFFGLDALVTAISTLTLEYPNAVNGTVSHWRFEFPRLQIEAPQRSDPYAGLIEALRGRPYRIEATFEASPRTLTLTAKPL